MIASTAGAAIALTGGWMEEGTESTIAWMREERVSTSISMPKAIGSTAGSMPERQGPEQTASITWQNGSTAKAIESRVILTKKATGLKRVWIVEAIASITDLLVAATVSTAGSIIEAIVTDQSGARG